MLKMCLPIMSLMLTMISPSSLNAQTGGDVVDSGPSTTETIDYLNAKFSPCQFRNRLTVGKDATQIRVSGETPVKWVREGESGGIRETLEQEEGVSHSVTLPLAELTTNVVIDIDNSDEDYPQNRGLARRGVKAVIRVNCGTPKCIPVSADPDMAERLSWRAKRWDRLLWPPLELLPGSSPNGISNYHFISCDNDATPRIRAALRHLIERAGGAGELF